MHPPDPTRARTADSPPDAGDTSDLLRGLLVRKDVDCPLCGYSLKGLTTSVCPECGMGLELQIRPTHSRMGAWITGLVGLASGFGFYLNLVGFFIWAAVVDGDLSDTLIVVWPLWLGLGIHGVLVLVWVRMMRPMRRRKKRTRIILAASCWAFTALGSIGLIWLFLNVLF